MFDLIASKGLGDAIYLRALVLHLIERGESVTVFTQWPDVFSDLPIVTKSLKERTGHEDIHHCQPCLHCRLPEVSIGGLFEMACRQAGVLDRVELRADWTVKNTELAETVRRAASGRKIMVYQPLKPARGVEQEILQPRPRAYVSYIESRSDMFRVKLGTGGAGVCDLDLTEKTTVSEAFDVATVADVIFGEPCYLTTLAQAMDKPYVCMFSSRAQWAVQSRVSGLTPWRFMTKPGTVLYDDD